MSLIKYKGINLPKNKTTTGIDITPLKPMDFYNVPLKLKNVSESTPVVSIGDEVKEGTLIARPSGKFGMYIYSPVCGKVLNIFNKVTSWGEYCTHILIMNNNQSDMVDLPEIESISDNTMIDRLMECGMFDTLSNMPTFLKYAYTGSKTYKHLFVLMDDIDPNCTVNQTLAEYKVEEVINGAKYFMNVASVSYVTFVFSDKNRELASKLRKHISETKKNYDYKIKFVPHKYPFANPYLLAQLLTGKKISKKTTFLDAGIALETAESCYNFCRAKEFNKPVTKKFVTIDGSNIIRKGNYSIPNGVSYENLINFAGVIDKNKAIQIIDGNLMYGKAQYNEEISISFNTNSIVIEGFDKYGKNEEFNCISCGRCASVCPMKLNPQKIENAYHDNDYEELKKLQATSCIECGCCSYVCPSRRYLTQRIANAKHFTNENGGNK